MSTPMVTTSDANSAVSAAGQALSPAVPAVLSAEKRAPRIIIQGITTEGRAFRPSDWAERLCGIMSSFGRDQQMRYSPNVQPVMLDGVRCVVVEPSLADVEPRAYRFLLDFARDNDLIVIDPAAESRDDFCPVPGNALENLAR